MAIQAISGVGREEQAEDIQNSLLAQAIRKQDDHSASLTQMIQEAKEKADDQREKFKLAKVTPRYGDAPLAAYARISRAKTPAEAGSAAGYARSRIAQLQAAQRSDPDHADQIRAAIGQLQKAVGRAGKKKLELNREQLARARQKRLAQAKRLREAKRTGNEIKRQRAVRAVRESGYFRETDIANRFASQLSATKMELRRQAQELEAAAQKSLDAAVQQYSTAMETVTTDVSIPQVDVQA